MKRVPLLISLFFALFFSQFAYSQYGTWQGMEETGAGDYMNMPIDIDRFALIGMDTDITPSSATGFGDSESDPIVTIYPNPVNRALNVDIGYSSGLLGDADILIYNMELKPVMMATFAPGQRPVIEVGELPTGTYTLIVTMNAKRHVRKFVKI